MAAEKGEAAGADETTGALLTTECSVEEDGAGDPVDVIGACVEGAVAETAAEEAGAGDRAEDAEGAAAPPQPASHTNPKGRPIIQLLETIRATKPLDLIFVTTPPNRMTFFPGPSIHHDAASTNGCS